MRIIYYVTPWPSVARPVHQDTGVSKTQLGYLGILNNINISSRIPTVRLPLPRNRNITASRSPGEIPGR